MQTTDQTETREAGSSPATLLGVNRVGTKILGLAWGEQDRPDAALLASVDEVRNFVIEEWIGDKDDPLVEQVMRELADHDWSEDLEIKWTFEVGALSLRDVFDVTPNDQAHPTAAKGDSQHAK